MQRRWPGSAQAEEPLALRHHEPGVMSPPQFMQQLMTPPRHAMSSSWSRPAKGNYRALSHAARRTALDRESQFAGRDSGPSDASTCLPRPRHWTSLGTVPRGAQGPLRTRHLVERAARPRHHLHRAQRRTQARCHAERQSPLYRRRRRTQGTSRELSPGCPAGPTRPPRRTRMQVPTARPSKPSGLRHR